MGYKDKPLNASYWLQIYVIGLKKLYFTNVIKYICDEKTHMTYKKGVVRCILILYPLQNIEAQDPSTVITLWTSLWAKHRPIFKGNKS